MELSQLWKSPPKLHKPRNKLINWGFTETLILWLAENVKPGDRTLETGSGISTIIFAMNKTQHIAIDPCPGMPDRVREYCNVKGVTYEHVRFIYERSEYVLPKLVKEEKIALDLAIIDGSHTFPTPFIDWFFIAQMLKINGRLLVDDMQLWQCAFLADWIGRQKEWTVDVKVSRATVFRKISDVKHPDNFSQQANMKWKF